MRSVFREDHEMFRQMARRFIENEITPHLHDWEKRLESLSEGSCTTLGAYHKSWQ